MFKVQNMSLQLTSVLANQVSETCILYIINAIIVRMYIPLVNLVNVRILRLAAVSWYPQARSPRCRFTSCE